MYFCRKNFTKGYSELEIKVRDVTSNDPRNPSGALMQEIATASHNRYVSHAAHDSFSTLAD
jgi:hypothetical protein